MIDPAGGACSQATCSVDFVRLDLAALLRSSIRPSRTSSRSASNSAMVRDPASESTSGEQIYNGSEGPVLIVREGKQVFVSESFDMTTARKLQFLFFGAQKSGETQQAMQADELTTHLTRLMASCGMMKASLRR